MIPQHFKTKSFHEALRASKLEYYSANRIRKVKRILTVFRSGFRDFDVMSYDSMKFQNEELLQSFYSLLTLKIFYKNNSKDQRDFQNSQRFFTSF